MHWGLVCGGVGSHWELATIDHALERGLRKLRSHWELANIDHALESENEGRWNHQGDQIRSGALRYHVVT